MSVRRYRVLRATYKQLRRAGFSRSRALRESWHYRGRIMIVDDRP